ncbi:MAG: extracellular solute-binding protein [Oceanospirillaceae bacterium]|nr:extracellular solute-binding protein [Oceanospirillaceae bacterium]
MKKINRRQLLQGMVTGAGCVAAASMFGSAAFAADTRIRHFWWGNPSRDERTYKVIDLFKNANPGFDVAGETIGWGDYWTKMATQTAGKNMADLVQMDYRFLFEYVHRGALLPLDEYFGKTLHLEDFDKSAIAGGMVDGKLYALNIGSNSQVMIYNKRLFAEAGIEFDPIKWNQAEQMDIAKKLSASTPKGVHGIDDATMNPIVWEAWTQQRGKTFYADGKVQAVAADLESFWEYWKEMRESGAAPSADVSVANLGFKMTESGIVTGATAMSQFWSNQIVGVQSLMKDEIGAAMLAHKKGGMPGQFIKPSMFMALTRDTKNPELATKYMNAWVNDPAQTAILGLERGVPASSKVRAALEPNLTVSEKVSVDYFNAIQSSVGPLPPPPPKGAGEVNAAFIRMGTNVILGRISIKDGAAEFIDEASSIVERAS